MTTVTQQIIAASEDPVGGLALLSAGTFEISQGIQVLSRTMISGVGMGVTVLRLADNSNTHMLYASGAHSIHLENLTLDANGAGQNGSGGFHGIRLAEIENVTLTNVEIINAKHYGIGAQDGSIRSLHISNARILKCGADGIDIKNRDNDNDDIQLHQILVDTFGLTNGDQAGIDIRGPVQLSQIRVRNVNIGQYGVRFRPVGAWGPGGKYSVLNGFYVTRSNVGNAGVVVQDSDVVVSNGVVDGCLSAVEVNSASRVSVAGVNSRDCTVGFRTIGSTDVCYVGCRTSGTFTPYQGAGYVAIP